MIRKCVFLFMMVLLLEEVTAHASCQGFYENRMIRHQNVKEGIVGGGAIGLLVGAVSVDLMSVRDDKGRDVPAPLVKLALISAARAPDSPYRVGRFEMSPEQKDQILSSQVAALKASWVHRHTCTQSSRQITLEVVAQATRDLDDQDAICTQAGKNEKPALKNFGMRKIRRLLSTRVCEILNGKSFEQASAEEEEEGIQEDRPTEPEAVTSPSVTDLAEKPSVPTSTSMGAAGDQKKSNEAK